MCESNGVDVTQNNGRVRYKLSKKLIIIEWFWHVKLYCSTEAPEPDVKIQLIALSLTSKRLFT